MTTGMELDLATKLDRLATGRLEARPELAEPDWRFWERRTLNLHRVVGLWSCRASDAKAADLGAAVRAALGRHFRRAWWRGLGFGVVLEAERVLLSPEESKDLIDGRENTRGTWQWLVQVARAQRTVVGVHTWAAGYLSPLYRSLLDELAGSHQIVSLMKERDGLMRLLTSTKPGLFPEFRDGDYGERRG